MMNMRMVLTAVAVGLGLAAGPARAGVIVYATGFEPPVYSPGPLVGQDGWVLSPNAGTLSGPAAEVVPAGGGLTSAALRVAGAQLQPDFPVDPYYYLGLYRRPVGYDAAANGTPLVSIRVDARLDGPLSPQTGVPGDYEDGDVYSANLAAVAGDGGALGEISLSADGHVYGYGYAGSYLFAAPVTLGEFHQLGLDIDFANGTTTYLLDGAVLGVDSFAGEVSSTVLNRVALLNYGNLAVPVPDGFERDQYTGYFDDLSITASAVPEPASVALLGLGAAGLAGRRLRRRG